MSNSTTESRIAQVSAVMEDPPDVHDGAPQGVWTASQACYEFIARNLPSEPTTLETGLGLSTVLFGMWATSHTCVVGSGDQVGRLLQYADNRDLDLSRVRFEVGTSDLLLPGLQLDPIDMFLIDGGHGFPHPAIDWYYGALVLRDGGIVVVDDVQLPSVHDYLITYLEKDPRWQQIGGDHKWLAFRKEGEFSVREEWTSQDFLGASRVRLVNKIKIGVHRQLSRFR